jgi:hypothetical protein
VRIRSQVCPKWVHEVYLLVKRVNNTLLESGIQRMNLHGNSQVSI